MEPGNRWACRKNSIAALRHAIDLGCVGSEFDVHMTADDSLIISTTILNITV
ncbi:MAG: hypothetical protein IPO69_08985 [Saprospiraceae bacterium]|nr:hypothetical protein [Saprospiraceae bacterium]